MRSVNGSGLDELAYLNQSNATLIDSSVVFSSAINYPYQIARSLYSAIASQYKEYEMGTRADSMALNTSTFVESVGYFFSNYAVGCFVTALVLNRIVAMASLRANAQRVDLPLWSKFLFHAVAIALLVYNVCITLGQLGIMPAQATAASDIDSYLAQTYTIICLSHCIETFITTTTNSKPMEEFDYTIFELSIQFYSLSRNSPALAEYAPDCLMALFGRLIIHFVELTNRRNRRLMLSTVLNCGYLFYMFRSMYFFGLDAMPLTSRYRHFPKLFSLFCILVSLACYLLACIARLNPFSSSGTTSDTSQLQCQSFMNNWYANLNCTGEEEFTTTLIKLAILVCNPEQSRKHGIHREFPELNSPADIHKSFFVSGYMQKWSTMPDDSNNASHQVIERSVWQKRVLAYKELTAAFAFRIKCFFKGAGNVKVPQSSTVQQRKNYNDYVTEKNYVKFLTAGADDSNCGSRYLLPEEDFSGDYLPSEDDEENYDDQDYEYAERHDEDDDDRDNEFTEKDGSINAELACTEALSDLIIASAPSSAQETPSDLSWFLSVWTILKCKFQENKRLTRSQYSKLNEPAILREVMIERLLTSAQPASSDSSGIDLACVVCKTNPRNIVLWPCRCFALCEECRVSLGLRGFKTCICCRSPVNGYSKLNAV
ncbi:LAFE_0C10198g1_1 [Lachancea fermentati]|uniref:LAFE_0C10198g1_1 n=1 Tax=Lachancea fermentati TaxID=4955 RepID=A0A1G4MAI4_LACFM|nr:LAFE_0C10198g1_1 [Lachancea fermentati]